MRKTITLATLQKKPSENIVEGEREGNPRRLSSHIGVSRKNRL